MDGIIPLIVAFIAVGVILYLSYLFSRYLAVGAAKINKSKYIKIIDRVVLGQDRLLLIAKIGEKHYLIGSASQSIHILTELDENGLFDTSTIDSFSEGKSFKDSMKRWFNG